jgi:uncharacterized protein
MTTTTTLDRAALEASLDDQGFARTAALLDEAACAELIAAFDDPGLWRSTVVMTRHGYGRGTYRYLRYPLPPVVAALRAELYPPLAAVANRWAGVLGGPTFPWCSPCASSRGRVVHHHGLFEHRSAAAVALMSRSDAG